jgi:hypothetical protein
MLIFNVFMFIFGGLTLSNGSRLLTGFAGSEQGTGNDFANMASFSVVLIGSIAGLGIAYGLTSIPGVGTAKTPLSYVYTVIGIAFQGIYISAFTTFWYPLINRVPFLSVFSILFTFLVESIFVIGFLQMTTGGWGLYK